MQRKAEFTRSRVTQQLVAESNSENSGPEESDSGDDDCMRMMRMCQKKKMPVIS